MTNTYEPEPGKAIICPWHGPQLGIACPVCSDEAGIAAKYPGTRVSAESPGLDPATQERIISGERIPLTEVADGRGGWVQSRSHGPANPLEGLVAAFDAEKARVEDRDAPQSHAAHGSCPGGLMRDCADPHWAGRSYSTRLPQADPATGEEQDNDHRN